MRNFRGRLFILPILLSLLFSCRKEAGLPQWDAELLLPLVKSELSIENIVGDSNTVVNPDNSVTLAYRFPLYHVTLKDLVPPYSLPYDVTFKLDSLELPDQEIEQPISLGRIASNAGVAGQLIILANGGSLPITPIGPLGPNSFEIDAAAYFESLSLKGGKMVLQFENGLPIDIENISYEMSNKVLGDLLLQDDIASIPAGATVSREYDMAGKTIESLLEATLISFETPGSNGVAVPIDTSDALNVKILITNLEVQEATTIWPEQNLIEEDKNANFDTGGETELTYSIISGGEISFEAYSTIEDSLYLSYRLPKTTKNGMEFSFASVIDPAPANGTSTKSESFDFVGYEMDLTGKNSDTTNAIYEIIIARIDSTGKLVHLSLEDSLRFAINLTDITLRYAEGFLASDTVNVDATERIEAFSKIIGGSLDLSYVTAKVEVFNYAGADARVIIDSIHGLNTRTGQSIALQLPGKQYDIGRAQWTQNPDDIVPVEFILDLNSSNSNIEEFFELLPDQVDLIADVFFNPGGAPGGQTDFMWDDKGLDADLMFELPLSLIADSLHLRDTSQFSLGAPEDIERIQSGQLIIDLNNGFPIEADIELSLIDEEGNFINHLISSSYIAAAITNSSGIVSSSSASQLIVELNAELIEDLKLAKEIAMDIRFSTDPGNTFLTIYNDYKIDLQIKGDFNYRLN